MIRFNISPDNCQAIRRFYLAYVAFSGSPAFFYHHFALQMFVPLLLYFVGLWIAALLPLLYRRACLFASCLPSSPMSFFPLPFACQLCFPFSPVFIHMALDLRIATTTLPLICHCSCLLLFMFALSTFVSLHARLCLSPFVFPCLLCICSRCSWSGLATVVLPMLMLISLHVCFLGFPLSHTCLYLSVFVPQIVAQLLGVFTSLW